MFSFLNNTVCLNFELLLIDSYCACHFEMCVLFEIMHVLISRGSILHFPFGIVVHFMKLPQCIYPVWDYKNHVAMNMHFVPP